MLVLIGTKWLPAPSTSRRALLFDEGDVLRREIAFALEKKRQIVPVLVDGAAMPGEAQLPEAIGPLVRRQAPRLSQESWDEDVSRLVEQMESLVEEADQ